MLTEISVYACFWKCVCTDVCTVPTYPACEVWGLTLTPVLDPVGHRFDYGVSQIGLSKTQIGCCSSDGWAMYGKM